VAGVAAQFHHQRRSADGRHPVPLGADRGLKSLIVSAGADGEAYKSWDGVKPLRHSQDKLRRANKAFSRTKEGSAGRAKAKARLAKLHRHIALQRSHVAHQASHDLATGVAVLCTEDLYVKGMMANHRLAKAVVDAAMGEAGRRLQVRLVRGRPAPGRALVRLVQNLLGLWAQERPPRPVRAHVPM
jgi:putative transposase